MRWSDSRQRWIAEVTTGHRPDGKRIVKTASSPTKTGAKNKLKGLVRDLDDGVPTEPGHYTVADAVTYWLEFGLSGRSSETLNNYTNLANLHLLPLLGKRKLRDLSVEDVDKWLAERATRVSTRTVRLLHSILNGSVKHAQARDKVKRNVVALCAVPAGLQGRPSKSMSFDQAVAVLETSEQSYLHAYIVLSLLIGARTEELRALTWDHVDLYGDANQSPPALPSISVWHSVRDDGDTKTKKSRRTLAMPTRCVVALRLHRLRQREVKRRRAEHWQENGLVFASNVGTELDSHNVRRAFRNVVDAAGLQGNDWTPREMRHSFVSLLSDSGVAIEDIARRLGHSGTAVTETVYRHQIRPVIVEGATAMDQLFPRTRRQR